MSTARFGAIITIRLFILLCTLSLAIHLIIQRNMEALAGFGAAFFFAGQWLLAVDKHNRRSGDFRAMLS